MRYISKFDKKLSFKLQCILCDFGNTPSAEKIYFNGKIKFDTGADITIFPARDIGLVDTSESEFTKWMQSNDKVVGIEAGHYNLKSLDGFSSHGVDKSAGAIISYAYQVERFDIKMDNGILKMGSVPITITFDDRVQEPLFGNDLLSLLNTTINNDLMQLELSFTKEFSEIFLRKQVITGAYMQQKGYYDSNNFLNKKKIQELIYSADKTDNGEVDYHL